MQLKEKRVLITGGTKGIGAAVAKNFAQHGAHLVINSRKRDDDAQQTLADIEAQGVTGKFIAADIADPKQVEELVAEAADALGGLDVLMHNAGGPAPGKVEDLTPEAWNNAFDVHVHAAYHLCRFGLPHLKKNSEGAILLVSSTAGLRGCPGAVVYGTVKGAIDQMTRMLARDLADDNIRVNCIAPGVVWTGFYEGVSESVRENNLKNRIPLHRDGTPEQIAEVAYLLATNDYITGETYVIDGGLTMQVTR